jgi:PAS domain S-box-containing protein
MPKERSTKELVQRVFDQQRRIEELTRTQQLLWEAVKRYRVIVEAGPDAIAVVSSGKIRFVNSAFTRLLGYTSDDVDDGLIFFDLLQDFDREAVLRQFEMNRHRDRWTVEVRTDLTAADGDPLPCDISVSRIDEAGKPAELLIIRGPFDRDQTEDEALKSRAERHFPSVTAGGGLPAKPLRRAAPPSDPLTAENPPVALPANHLSVLEAQPDPAAAYDLTGRILYVNASFTRVFGWRAEELVGKRIDFVPDESWPQTAEAIERLLQGEKIESFDTRRRTKDRRLLDVELSASLFYGPAGRPGGSIVILRDVTGIKKSQRELRRSVTKFRHLVETMNAGIGILSEEGKILYVNRKLQELIGYAKNELVGRRWEYFLDEAGRCILEQAKAGFERGVWKRFELDIRRKEGKVVSLLVAPSPLLDAGGVACGSVAVYTEIRREKQAPDTPAGSEKDLPAENLKQAETAGET